MKTLLTAYLPALALLALGGCAGTTALTTSENDGVYYSSADHTTAVAPSPGYAAPAQAPASLPAAAAPAPSTDEATNPDYTGSTAATGTTGSDQYYNGSSGYDPNASIFNQPYTGPGMGAYTPSSPYTSLGYGGADPYYGGGFGGYGYSPYSAFASPFYSPFYSPFGFGYGSGISIGFGFGRPFGYGYGGYGYDPFFGPFGYGGYGLGYGYGGGFYGGYGGGYYGRNVIYTGSGARYDNGAGGNTVLVGPRGSRAGAAYGRNGVAGGTVSPAAGVANPGQTGANVLGGRGRRGVDVPVGQNPAMSPGQVGSGGVDPTAGGRGRLQNMGQAVTTGTNQSQQAQGISQGQAQQPRRGFFREMFSSPSTGQPVRQPQQVNNGGGMSSGTYNPGASTSQPRSRMYSDQSQQRSYQPQQQMSQPQRSFSQPQRSFSQPSFGGSRSSGGGSFGGGGGGRSGGGGRGHR